MPGKTPIIGGNSLMLVSKAWKSYYNDKLIEGYSTTTLKAYKIQATLLIKHFSDIEIAQITTDALKEYLVFVGEKLKPASLTHRVRFIKSLFRLLMKRVKYKAILPQS